MPKTLVERFIDARRDGKVRLGNVFGPTEACVYATVHWLTPAEAGRIPIGKPLPNYEIYVLGKELGLRLAAFPARSA